MCPCTVTRAMYKGFAVEVQHVSAFIATPTMGADHNVSV